MPLFRRLAASCSALLFWLGPTQAAELRAYTEEFPPFNYRDGERISGYAHELLLRIAREAGISVDVILQPWPRALQSNERDANSLLFTTVRTPQREQKYRWVGPLDSCDIELLKLAGRRDIRIVSLTDLHQYSIGLPAEGADREVLQPLNLAPDKLIRVPSSGSMVRMFYAGRFDLVSGIRLSYAYQARRLGLPAEQVESAWLLKKGYGCYYAFNPAVDDALYQRFAAAFATLLQNGEVARLRDSYLH
ncbi:substrate-binding periplasmic protein [Chitinilyticum litopenaei]|uniref:substrate-binding periplasmic protein n=1 Tax=Chitinilyticum litopenaei TaxID=1121276 RepID=UPI000422384C|nr:transporter substrate-binding domain-containing protein [Chitinilyticum litopenaei]